MGRVEFRVRSWQNRKLLAECLSVCCITLLATPAHLSGGVGYPDTQPVGGSNAIRPFLQQGLVSVWTNRTGETISGVCSAITNQTVYLVLPSGLTRSLPLRIFPESEQLRMKLALGVAPMPGGIVPVWRLFESQLESARDVEGTRSALGFVVKQVKKLEGERTVSTAEATYWIACASQKERAVRQALLEKEAQAGLRQKVSAAQQQGKE